MINKNFNSKELSIIGYEKKFEKTKANIYSEELKNKHSKIRSFFSNYNPFSRLSTLKKKLENIKVSIKEMGGDENFVVSKELEDPKDKITENLIKSINEIKSKISDNKLSKQEKKPLELELRGLQLILKNEIIKEKENTIQNLEQEKIELKTHFEKRKEDISTQQEDSFYTLGDGNTIKKDRTPNAIAFDYLKIEKEENEETQKIDEEIKKLNEEIDNLKKIASPIKASIIFDRIFFWK